MYNYRDVSRQVFTQGLAFDLAPSASGIKEEAELIRVQAHILEMDESCFDISMLYTPIFSGLGIQLQIVLRNTNFGRNSRGSDRWVYWLERESTWS